MNRPDAKEDHDFSLSFPYFPFFIETTMLILRVYHLREHKKFALWHIMDKRYEEYEKNYSDKFENKA